MYADFFVVCFKSPQPEGVKASALKPWGGEYDCFTGSKEEVKMEFPCLPGESSSLWSGRNSNTSGQ